MGDSSDNVPGVAGVGVKTAVKLLQEYGGIDKVFENTDKITNKRVHNGLINCKDDAYLSNAFYDAVPAYSQALEIGDILLRRSVDLITATLSAGEEALDAGNATLALEQFELVLSIEDENLIARAGLIRAQRLPEVLSLMKTGEDLRREADYETAANHYREALTIDSLWLPARTALEAVNTIISDRRFDTLMSQGLGALMEEDYSDAYDFFDPVSYTHLTLPTKA